MKDIRTKYKGKTFAEASELVSAKYPKRELVTADMNAFYAEMDELEKLQKVAQARQDAVDARSLNGEIPEYGLGTPEPVDTLGLSIPVNPILEEGLFSDGVTQPTPYANSATPLRKAAYKAGQALESPYAPTVSGQALSLGLNAAMLAGGYDDVQPEYNLNDNKTASILGGLSTDSTAVRNAILSQRNAGLTNIQNQGRTPAVQNALLANFDANVGGQLAESELKESQANNQYKTNYANLLNNQGGQAANARSVAKDLTARNKGAFQNELSKLGVSLADNGKFITRMKLNENQNKLAIDILNSKYSDFGLSEKVANQLLSGKTTDSELIELKKSAKGNDTLLSFLDLIEENKNKNGNK